MLNDPSLFDKFPQWIEFGNIHWYPVIIYGLLIILAIYLIKRALFKAAWSLISLLGFLFIYAYVGQLVHSEFQQLNPILAISGVGDLVSYLLSNGLDGVVFFFKNVIKLFGFDLPIALRDLFFNFIFSRFALFATRTGPFF